MATRMNEWIDGLMDGWTDGRTDGRMAMHVSEADGLAKVVDPRGNSGGL